MDTRAEASEPSVMAATPTPAAPVVLLSTGSLFHLPLPRIARIALGAGFAGLELVMGSPAIAPGAALSEAHSLCPVRAVHAPFRNWSDWGGHKNAWRAAVELATHLLEASGQPNTPGAPGALGAPPAILTPPGETCPEGTSPDGGEGPAEWLAEWPMPVTLHPPGQGLRDAVQARWFSRAVDLPRLLDAPEGVALCLENLPWSPNAGGLFGRDLLAELLAECGHRGLLLTLDACHLGVSGRDVLADLARVPAGLLGHAHVSDAEGFAEHLAPGAGALPLGPYLTRLGARGDVRTVSLELDPAQLPQDEAGQIETLARLREGMERALAGNAPPEWSGSPAARSPRFAALA